MSRSQEAISLLQKLIATPSFSKEEDAVAQIMFEFLQEHGVNAQRHLNNIWAVNEHFNDALPTLLLNSHLDTVRPNKDWTRDPFVPSIEDDTLYGLGSNDAGASLVSYASCFLHFYHQASLPFNIVFAATAEEETSGENGIVALLPVLPPISFAMVGEPTDMQMAIAEKGLMVLRCTAVGRSGHAARNEGLNAIDIAVQDIQWLHSYRFDAESPTLGPVKMTCTIIQAGTQHNVVPDRCQFTVDVRTTDAYNNDETLRIIREHLQSQIEEVSRRLQPSRIEESHALVHCAKALAIPLYGSPTLSDQALLPLPSVKIGPGSSSRSHTAQEFIHLSEIEQGIETLIRFVEQLQNHLSPKPHETLG